MSAENTGLAELRELVALSALEPTGMLDLFEDLRSLTDDGLPTLVADVDGLAAVPALGAVPAYKIPDRLKVRLAALRARHVDTGKVESAGSVHGTSSEITAAMLAAGIEALKLSYDTDGGLDPYPEVVTAIFTAMIQASA